MKKCTRKDRNMEELYVFGTGNAQATRCYNTCFAIKDGDEFFMVDAGGGNGERAPPGFLPAVFPV